MRQTRISENDAASHLRQVSNLPMIFLTAEDMPEDALSELSA